MTDHQKLVFLILRGWSIREPRYKFYPWIWMYRKFPDGDESDYMELEDAYKFEMRGNVLN